MTQEDKELLLKDLCARLPYGVIMTNRELPATHYPLTCEDLHDAMFDDDWDDVPYLRPMSSMTEEEREELKELTAADIVTNTGFGYKNLRGMCFGMMYLDCQEIIDWFNKKMFDFRGLIPKDLALSTDEFNPYKD